MPASTDCLSGLVGITQAGSSCFPLPQVIAPATNEYVTASSTGLYVDQVEGLSLKPAPNNTAGLDVYQRLTNARNQAIQAVANQLARNLSSDKPLFREAGLLGGLGNGSFAAVNGAARLTLKTIERPNGALRIDTLALYTDQTIADVAVKLDGVEIARISTNSGPLALTGASISLDGQTHILEAVLPEGTRVRNNTLTCGCGNLFVNAMRLNLSDVKSSAGGFALQVSEVCTAPQGLCYALNEEEELARSVGFAIQYTAAATFAAGLLVDSSYSRYTMLEPKNLDLLGQRWTSKADEHLAWLLSPQGLARVKHPCYSCSAPSWHPTIQTVR